MLLRNAKLLIRHVDNVDTVADSSERSFEGVAADKILADHCKKKKKTINTTKLCVCVCVHESLGLWKLSQCPTNSLAFVIWYRETRYDPLCVVQWAAAVVGKLSEAANLRTNPKTSNKHNSDGRSCPGWPLSLCVCVCLCGRVLTIRTIKILWWLWLRIDYTPQVRPRRLLGSAAGAQAQEEAQGKEAGQGAPHAWLKFSFSSRSRCPSPTVR